MGCNTMSSTLRNIRPAPLCRRRIKSLERDDVLIRRIQTVAAAKHDIMLPVYNHHRPRKARRRRDEAAQREEDAERVGLLAGDLPLEGVLVIVWVPVEGELDARGGLLREVSRGQIPKLRRCWIGVCVDEVECREGEADGGCAGGGAGEDDGVEVGWVLCSYGLREGASCAVAHADDVFEREACEMRVSEEGSEVVRYGELGGCLGGLDGVWVGGFADAEGVVGEGCVACGGGGVDVAVGGGDVPVVVVEGCAVGEELDCFDGG